MNILKGAENNTRILVENNNRLEKMLQHFLVTLLVSQIRRLPVRCGFIKCIERNIFFMIRFKILLKCVNNQRRCDIMYECRYKYNECDLIVQCFGVCISMSLITAIFLGPVKFRTFPSRKFVLGSLVTNVYFLSLRIQHTLWIYLHDNDILKIRYRQKNLQSICRENPRNLCDSRKRYFLSQ